MSDEIYDNDDVFSFLASRLIDKHLTISLQEHTNCVTPWLTYKKINKSLSQTHNGELRLVWAVEYDSNANHAFLFCFWWSSVLRWQRNNTWLADKPNAQSMTRNGEWIFFLLSSVQCLQHMATDDIIMPLNDPWYLSCPQMNGTPLIAASPPPMSQPSSSLSAILWQVFLFAVEVFLWLCWLSSVKICNTHC